MKKHTKINYPVMQTPNNPNYYLKHNFEKEYSDLGTPYAQENCDLLPSDNLKVFSPIQKVTVPDLTYTNSTSVCQCHSMQLKLNKASSTS